MSEVTRLLDAAAAGDRKAAADLLPLVYDELRKLAAARMAAEAPGHTLDATALVHEAYLRLVGEQQFDGRGHFFAAAAGVPSAATRCRSRKSEKTPPVRPLRRRRPLIQAHSPSTR
jgi:DNA-directed RNA polymerase specialized sigma24 family protein